MAHPQQFLEIKSLESSSLQALFQVFSESLSSKMTSLICLSQVWGKEDSFTKQEVWGSQNSQYASPVTIMYVKLPLRTQKFSWVGIPDSILTLPKTDPGKRQSSVGGEKGRVILPTL
jgi:hypothetical protein